MRQRQCNNKACGQSLILCPCPAPKRVLTSSNWISRNDSSNISAILHPENYLCSPRLKYGEKTKGDVAVKHLLSRNNCYCKCKNKKLPRPSFFKRPNSCVSYETVSKTDKISDYGGYLKRRSFLDCVCKDSDDDARDPDALRSRETTSKVSEKVGLQYNDKRKKSEEYRQIQEVKFVDKLQDYEDNERFEQLGEELAAGDSGKVDTILATRNYGTETSMSNYLYVGAPVEVSARAELPDDILTDEFPVYSEWSVPNFRKEHYFETHSVGKLGEFARSASQGPHTCIHQFKLNDRCLPVPVNKDAFGRSICKICERPMDGSNVNVSSGYLFNGDGVSRSRIKSYAEAYKSGFTPTTINFGRGKSQIELILRDRDVPRFSSYITKVKKPDYCNSLALRHQRMRLA